MFVLLMVLAFAAQAYETNPLTRRGQPPADITASANARVDVLLDQAVQQTNRRTRCRRSFEATRRTLARRVFKTTARQTQVPGKGFFHRFGHGAYSAWLESDAPERIDYPDRSHLFGEAGFWRSPFMYTVGPAATVRVAGVMMGTDKLHHFFSLGHDYVRHARWDEDPERAVRYGHRSELFPFGLLTSQAYSFGDLRANWSGYGFYVDLLSEDSVLALDEAGCVARVGDWDWAEHIDPAFDELVNPTVYSRGLQRFLDAQLPRDRETLCAGWSEWGPALLAWRQAVRDEHGFYVRLGKAPPQTDPFQLEQLCGALN